MIDRVVFRIERGVGPGFWIGSIVAEVVLGILAAIIAARFSRYREFRADAGGAELAGRGSMIAALQRLRQAQEQPGLPGEMAAFGIRDKPMLGALLSTHPPLEKRIERLSQTAG